MVEVHFKNWVGFIRAGQYYNGRIAMQLIDAESHDVIAVATVNVDEIDIDPTNEVIIKNYSENAGMTQSLIDAGIINPPHRFEKMGFVTFEVAKMTHTGKTIVIDQIKKDLGIKSPSEEFMKHFKF